MSLSTYRKKRKFASTPEPTGGKAKRDKLRFVIQEHAARNLHFDLRLEADGVLKSWAVPKSPTLDPSKKRLAIQVEDHPIDYLNFEGEIPAGNYGAGTVVIWDQGSYNPTTATSSKKKKEAILLEELEKGEVHFILEGKKMRGAFSLIRMKEKEQWLLIKQRDKYASKDSLSTHSTKGNQQGTDQKKKKDPEQKTASSKKSSRIKKGNHRSNGSPAVFVPPMLASLAAKDFIPGQQEWIFEVKWDGYRSIAVCQQSEVHLYSRNHKLFDDRFHPIREALEQLQLDAVIDGEIVAYGKTEYPQFERLQRWQEPEDGPLAYYTFDLLMLNGHSLMGIPLVQRKELLRLLLPRDEKRIRYSKEIKKSRASMISWAKEKGLEGIIAKRANSIYEPGKRSSDWLKIKLRNSEEVIIGGYTTNSESGRLFSSLLAGKYEAGILRYFGKIGTGFTESEQKNILKKLKKLEKARCPFTDLPEDVNRQAARKKGHTDIFWVAPELVASVNFTELTSNGIMRHASFKGLRDDKSPALVIKEPPASRQKQPGKSQNITSAFLQDDGNDNTERKIGGHALSFTNLSKPYWPKDGISKRELLNYYHAVAPYIMPYLIYRPQSLHRFPGGINSKSFYQKDVTDKVPHWALLHPYTTEKGQKHHYLVPQSEADLLFMVNWGTIEMNPWSSTIENPDFPSWCLLDLDPGTGTSFDDAIKVATVIRKILEDLNVASFPKTSGATGIHIYLALGEEYTYDESQLFAKLIALEAEKQLPNLTTTERSIRKRKGRLYIDYLQNRNGATLAAPYSVRPRPAAPVSTPLAWSEVKKGLSPTDFTIRNVVKRVEKKGDIFKPVLGKGIDIKKILTKFSNTTSKK